MCVPARSNFLRTLDHPPLAKCPSNVFLQIGNEIENASAIRSPPNARRRRFNIVLKKVLFGSCLTAACCFTFLSRGTHALSSRIDALARDIDSSERLKRDLVDEQLELRWERQHAEQLETTIASMRDSFGRAKRSFHEEETELVARNEVLAAALDDRNSSVASARLSRHAAAAHAELESEEGDNALLKREFATMVSEMRKENIPLPQVALRGAAALKLR